jgi:hypothetical protein
MPGFFEAIHSKVIRLTKKMAVLVILLARPLGCCVHCSFGKM